MGFVGAHRVEFDRVRSGEHRRRTARSANHRHRAARMGLVCPTRIAENTFGTDTFGGDHRLCRVARCDGNAFLLGGAATMHDDRPASSSSLAAVFGSARGPSTGFGYRFLFAVLDASRRVARAFSSADVDDREPLRHYVRHDGALPLVVFGRGIRVGLVLVVFDAVGHGALGSAHSAGTGCSKRIEWFYRGAVSTAFFGRPTSETYGFTSPRSP